MSRVFQHVAAMKRLDWADRHNYWNRLARRRGWGFMRQIAECFAPDELWPQHSRAHRQRHRIGEP